MALYVGDDWSEDHHDVHLMNEGSRSGKELARCGPWGGVGVQPQGGVVVHTLSLCRAARKSGDEHHGDENPAQVSHGIHRPMNLTEALRAHCVCAWSPSV